MTLNEYQKRAMATCMASCNNTSYMMLNLVGEVGELASKMAKHIRKKEATIHGNKFMYDAVTTGYEQRQEYKRLIKAEAGDILWQLAGLCHTMGWTLEEIGQENLDKLQSRKQRGTIDGNGDER